MSTENCSAEQIYLNVDCFNENNQLILQKLQGVTALRLSSVLLGREVGTPFIFLELYLCIFTYVYNFYMFFVAIFYCFTGDIEFLVLIIWLYLCFLQ